VVICSRYKKSVKISPISPISGQCRRTNPTVN
jgi:hypothetical protein